MLRWKRGRTQEQPGVAVQNAMAKGGEAEPGGPFTIYLVIAPGSDLENASGELNVQNLVAAKPLDPRDKRWKGCLRLLLQGGADLLGPDAQCGSHRQAAQATFRNGEREGEALTADR